MIIGIPKEIMHGENRVAVTPETVRNYILDGHEIIVEKGAGSGAHFTDEEYIGVGALIEEDVKKLYSKAQLILKVKEPQFNKTENLHEIDMMHKGQYIITFIHPASPINHQMVNAMARKGIIGLTLDSVPRISRAQSMDALTSMSTCAGYKGMLIAVDHMKKFIPQIFSAVGMIKPANVIIIGAGVSGLQAIATAKRLGAIVYAADIRPDAIENAKSLGAKIVDTNIPEKFAIGTGGYALSLTEKLLKKERSALKEAVADADIVFLGALVPGKVAPILVDEEMVLSMKPGSVIVDVSIDQGGNCSLTVPAEIIVEHEVTIIGIKNIPGLIPTSSTWMFANNIYNLVKHLIKDDELKLDLSDEILESILVTDGTKIVHKGTLEAIKNKKL
ncbi:MAG TPA: NAD(P) transhydrogenase subunit alpha [Acholeplasmataceae bacterium]|nr:NAD(P) transhydrogenase subunit alpha [Acholeplasmataceae bacterium]